ncbi:tRNA-modifying protein YgfZ [Thalassotalea aquiviva]|uniref:tRNA-modifying protein YgfZ n=1 Tax=Thalassotalea aquiviva TaxID=3242415 RepID=UPI00352A7AC4
MNTQDSLPALTQLPSDFAIKVDNLSAIRVTGPEADKYLQGQLTCDMNQLASKQLLVGGHCDAKGKMFAAFRLVSHDSQRLLIQSQHSLNASMAELQKFGVFAKVEIEQANDLAFMALVGAKAKEYIAHQFEAVPDSFTPVLHQGTATVVFISGKLNRYLLIDTQANIEALMARLELPVFSSKIWTLLEIVSGFVHMNEASVNEYVPQMLNLQHLNGISFSKGCYLGQETVARMKYLGKNKRALFALLGQGQAELSENDLLEVQMGDSWRRGGNIIASYQSDNGEVYLQAVLSNDSSDDSLFRIKGQEDIEFKVIDLPYTINQTED